MTKKYRIVESKELLQFGRVINTSFHIEVGYSFLGIVLWWSNVEEFIRPNFVHNGYYRVLRFNTQEDAEKHINDILKKNKVQIKIEKNIIKII
jgi:hypothetical protein